MWIGQRLDGRAEKRLPIVIAVRLSPAAGLLREEELTYTDNVSQHGARIVSKRSWNVGESANVASLKEGVSINGEAVYCQSVGKNFFVGFKFLERVTWSPLNRYQVP